MNESVTVHGNITADPQLRFSRGGTAVLSFSIASNRRRFNRQTSSWGDRPPVYYRVVCFNQLAQNATGSLVKGATVTVTGEFTDDSYTPPDADTPIRRIQLEATDIAVSLKYATVAITKNQRPDTATARTEEPTNERPDEPAAAEDPAAA